MDTSFLLAGMLTAAAYFADDTAEQREIRTLANDLYLCVDWKWAQPDEQTICHGWKPESGFLKYRWQGYDEATLLYTLALGVTHPSATGERLPCLVFHLRVETLLRH